MPLTINQAIRDIVLLLLGFALIASSMLAGEWGLCLFTFGTIAMIYGVAEVALTVFDSNLLTRFRKNQKGIAWVWAVCFLAIGFCPFIYWALGWPLDMVASYITGQYTFTGTMALAWSAARLLISYILAWVLICAVIWAWVNARSTNQQ